MSRPFTWRIPVYQRHYAWDAENESGPVHLFWETVEDQTVARLEGKAPPPHYLGAVLVDEKAQQDPLSEKKDFDVVDGQQRLTTIQLALLALIKVAEERGAAAKEALGKYIFSDTENEEAKLWPTNFDNKQYRTVLFEVYGEIMARRVLMSDENAKKSKVMVNFEFLERRFRNLIARYEDDFGVNKVIQKLRITILSGFDLVLIALRETDEAQKVFESLNNYSKPLTTFDLIRNHVFYRAAQDGHNKDVDLFNMPIWQKLEDPYWDEAAGQRTKGDQNTHIEAYIARMLVAKMRDENIKFNRNDIFKAYKKFSNNYPKVVEEVESVGEYTDIYKYLATGTEKNPVTGFRFGVFRWDAWTNKDFYPLIFVILKSGIDILEQQKMIDMLESYVVRRGVCGLPSGNYNKDTASMCKRIGEHPRYAVLREVLTISEKETSRFPEDEEVRYECLTANFYKSPFNAYILEEIVKWKDESMGDEIDIHHEKKLAVDHILPQGWMQNLAWKNALLKQGGGSQNEDALFEISVRQHIDTIGNLTLMSRGRNSRKSNKSWDSAKKLLRESGFQMNRELAEKSEWGLSEIEARSRDLADVICQRWPFDI